MINHKELVIDPNSNNEILIIDIPAHMITVMVSNDEGGVSVDMFPMDRVVDEPIAAIWSTTEVRE